MSPSAGFPPLQTNTVKRSAKKTGAATAFNGPNKGDVVERKRNETRSEVDNHKVDGLKTAHIGVEVNIQKPIQRSNCNNENVRILDKIARDQEVDHNK